MTIPQATSWAIPAPDPGPLVKLGDVRQWLREGDEFDVYPDGRTFSGISGPRRKVVRIEADGVVGDHGLLIDEIPVRLISPRWELIGQGNQLRKGDVMFGGGFLGIWEQTEDESSPGMLYRLVRSRLATRKDVRVGMRVSFKNAMTGDRHEGIVTFCDDEEFQVDSHPGYFKTDSDRADLPVEILAEAPEVIFPEQPSAPDPAWGSGTADKRDPPRAIGREVATSSNVEGWHCGVDLAAGHDRTAQTVTDHSGTRGLTDAQAELLRIAGYGGRPDPHAALREQFSCLCNQVDWHLVAEIHRQREWAPFTRDMAQQIFDGFVTLLGYTKPFREVEHHLIVVDGDKVEIFSAALNAAAYRAKLEELQPRVETKVEPAENCNLCQQPLWAGRAQRAEMRDIGGAIVHTCGDCVGTWRAPVRTTETEPPPPSPHDWSRGWATPSWEG